MLYSVYDNDLNKYCYTGRNSATREQAILAIFEFVQSDMEEEDKKSSSLWNLQEKEEYITCLCNYEIEEHAEKMSEE